MSESRKYVRTSMKVKVKVWHDSIGELVVNTRDISDGGIFLLTEDIEMPPIGSVLKGQAQGMPIEAPIVQLEIVRIEPMGVGLRFIQN